MPLPPMGFHPGALDCTLFFGPRPPAAAWGGWLAQVSKGLDSAVDARFAVLEFAQCGLNIHE
jgi:hypothetical protein